MDGLAAAASGLSAAQGALGIWANDLANAQTAGFVAEHPLITEGPVRAMPPTGLPGNVGSGAALAAAGRWLSGGITQTGNPSDLALTGRGFFAVALPGGAVGLTRSGAFHWSSDGHLVTAGGLRVLDTTGKPVALPTGSNVNLAAIRADGQVAINGKATGIVLGVATPVSLNAAQGGPEGTLVPIGRTTLGPVPPQGLQVGALNMSGVSLTAAIVGVLRAERTYIATTKALAAESTGLKTIAGL